MPEHPATPSGEDATQVLPSQGVEVSGYQEGTGHEGDRRGPALVVLDVTRPRRPKMARTIPGARDATGATQRNWHARDELVRELDRVCLEMGDLGAAPNQRTRSEVVRQIVVNYLESYPDATSVARALVDGWVE